MINKVKRNKKITTIMNTIGTVIAVVFVVIGIVLLKISSNAVNQSANYVNNHEFNELTGGFEILGGNIGEGGLTFAVMVSFLLLAVAIILLIVFLVPTIHGVILWKKTNQYLSRGESVYRSAALRDSIIKLVFNGIPAVWLLSTLFDDWNIIIAVNAFYLIIICVLEVNILINMKKEKNNYGNYTS